MKDEVRQTRSYLMDLFAQHGYNPRTDLGQNFLIDLNIVEYIVQQAQLSSRDVVLEIGSGTGGMTTFLAQTAGQVVSVEIDSNMYALASAETAELENVQLLNTDALKNKNHFAPEVLEAVQAALDVDPQRTLKLIANLPYSVATPVVSNLVATELPWSRMVITIQYELGLRMAAKPRNSHYGSLSVWLQSQCQVKLLKKLKNTVFWPRPKVNSAIVLITPDPKARGQIVDRKFFLDFIRRVFHQRRKLLRSTLVGMYSQQLSKPEVDEILQELKFGEDARAEQTPVHRLVALSNRLREVIQGDPSGTELPEGEEE